MLHIHVYCTSSKNLPPLIIRHLSAESSQTTSIFVKEITKNFNSCPLFLHIFSTSIYSKYKHVSCSIMIKYIHAELVWNASYRQLRKRMNADSPTPKWRKLIPTTSGSPNGWVKGYKNSLAFSMTLSPWNYTCTCTALPNSPKTLCWEATKLTSTVMYHSVLD